MAEEMGGNKRQAFLCGYKPKGQVQLTREEKKIVRNFKQFLRGKGNRCPECLHKAEKHVTRCGAKDCDCTLDYTSVIAVRKQIKAP